MTEPRPHSRDDDQADTGSWDDFWAEIERAELAERDEAATEVIRGVRVVVPHDLPLRFDRKLIAVQESDDMTDVHDLVTDLFGDDVFERWVAAGMTSIEFQTVLAWGIAHGKGRRVSFAEAYEVVRSGKDRQSQSTKQASKRSGGASKPTSRASTGSRRRK